MAYGIDIIKNNYQRPTRLGRRFKRSRCAISLSKELNVELPIVDAIYKIINKKSDIKDIIKNLLADQLKMNSHKSSLKINILKVLQELFPSFFLYI